MANDKRIGSVAVLGAGTMGAQIAAHFANTGVPVLLLDVTPEAARDGLTRAQALKPDPFFTRDTGALITTGGFDTDLQKIAGADWILEAVVEQLEIKRALFTRVDEVRSPGSIVSSNTSGIPITALTQSRSVDFRRHFLGTHFFNPPRYLHLLEVIPSPDTQAAVLETVTWFADHRLGKGVVTAKDTPNFIANHIGVFGLIRILRALESGDYTIEEIDAMTGPALGRPRSATFRTMDIVGIDVLAQVARNMASRARDDDTRRAFEVPTLIDTLVERGWIGEKAGQGFYKRAGSEILTLEPATLTYRPRQTPRLASLDAASGDDVGERVRTLFLGRDKVGSFLKATLGTTLVYTAKVAPTIANTIDDVDRAMRWGFGWDLGPFELWDAIGITAVLDAADPGAIPPIVAPVLKSARDKFRTDPLPPAAPDLLILKSAKERQRVVQQNPGASLIDLGDGILAVEFHSKMNAIGGDTVQMITAGLKEAAKNFAAMVIGSDAADFSAGANLMLLLLEAQEGNWDDVDLMVRTFQQANLALKYADVPVIAAPAGLTLGGGCEIVMHSHRAQAAAESYIGLVEVGVGLIPGGGGTKELLLRSMDGAPPRGDVLPFVQRAFETIAFATVSSSAAHARQLLFLRDSDNVSMNRERLMADAKALALEYVRAGYQRSQPKPIPVGGERVEAALKLGVHLAWRAGRISDHDARIGRLLAHVLAGGSSACATTISEQQLLDLEREAFLKLCGERKTLERIQHTLKTGKPLRN